MHPPGSQWISPRTSLLGLSAAALSVLSILAVGMAVATYKVQDVNERGAVEARAERVAQWARDTASRDGVWPSSVAERLNADDLVFTVPPDTPFADVHPKQLVLVQRLQADVKDEAVIAGLLAETKPQRFDGETPKADGFTYGDPIGRTLADVVGTSAGVGIAVVLGSGDVLMLQDETPVRDLQRFLTAESAAATERGRYLDTFALKSRR